MKNGTCFLCGVTADTSIDATLVHWVRCASCGSYGIHMMATDHIDTDSVRAGHLRIVARRRSDERAPVTFTRVNIDELAASVRFPSSPLKAVDDLLLEVAKGSAFFGAQHAIAIADYPRFGLPSSEYLEGLAVLARDLEFADLEDADSDPGLLLSLKPSGWSRVDELTRLRGSSDSAFVAMSFHPDHRKIYDEGIRPALVAACYVSIHIGDEQFNGKIDDAIVAEIRKASLVVADFTGHKKGVYWEAGFAAGLGTEVIFTCNETEIDDLHFDVRQTKTILWKNHQDLYSQLLARIRATNLSLEPEYRIR